MSIHLSVCLSVTKALQTVKHQLFHLTTIIITILNTLTSFLPPSSVHHPSTFLQLSFNHHHSTTYIITIFSPFYAINRSSLKSKIQCLTFIVIMHSQSQKQLYIHKCLFVWSSVREQNPSRA